MTAPVGLCGQCNQTLPADTVSLYFCDLLCQQKWYMARLVSDEDRRIVEPWVAPPAMFRGAA